MENLDVNGKEVSVFLREQMFYLSLHNIIENIENKALNLIDNWFSDSDTLQFLGIWESKNNPVFNDTECRRLMNESKSAGFFLSASDWINLTQSVGIIIQPNDEIYASKQIAFQFAYLISEVYRFQLIKAFIQFEKKYTKKEIAPVIQKSPLPPKLTANQINRVYDSEEDIICVALFGLTQSEWQKQNPRLIGNIRDHARHGQLICLNNLEIKNRQLIKEKLSVPERLRLLNEIAIHQMDILTDPSKTRNIRGIFY